MKHIWKCHEILARHTNNCGIFIIPCRAKRILSNTSKAVIEVQSDNQ